MITATRRFTFSAGHRLKEHPGWCRNLHGHNYVAEVTFVRKDAVEGDLDDNEMVVDFGKIKMSIGDWLHANWDHQLILDTDDELCERLGIDFSIYRMDGAPTAENMARHLFYDIIPAQLSKEIWKEDYADVEVFRVVIWESENSKAVVE